MINFSWHTFEALNTAQLYDILSLRQNVFIIEQRCFYQDVDYKDQQALHLLGTKDNRLISYLRFFPLKVIYSGSFVRISRTNLICIFAKITNYSRNLISSSDSSIFM